MRNVSKIDYLEDTMFPKILFLENILYCKIIFTYRIKKENPSSVRAYVRPSSDHRRRGAVQGGTCYRPSHGAKDPGMRSFGWWKVRRQHREGLVPRRDGYQWEEGDSHSQLFHSILDITRLTAKDNMSNETWQITNKCLWGQWLITTLTCWTPSCVGF